VNIQIELFLEMNAKLSPQLCNHDWIYSFTFCIDSPQGMNELNTNLQEAHHLVNELFEKITMFETKRQL
jgi:hypothetical protein